MAEEHHLFPVGRRSALRAAWVVGVSAIVGSLLPLAAFGFFSVSLAVPLAVVTASVVLFAMGVYKARPTVGHPIRSGLELAAIGTLSALVGFAVGAAFHVPVVS
jgi:predicted membrane protein (TIGR00267 family)